MIRKVILILGKTGTGKSTLAKTFFDRAPRVIVLDPLWEYTKVDLIAIDTYEMLNFFLASKKDSFKVAYQGGDAKHIDSIFRLCWTLGNVLLIVDEADLYLEQKNKYFDALIEQGRHRNVSLCCVVRRTPEVKRNFRSQQTSLFTFFQDEPSDLKHLQEWGFSPGGIDMLKPLEWPASPKEGVNYLTIGEKAEEIDFKRMENLTSKSLLDL